MQFTTQAGRYKARKTSESAGEKEMDSGEVAADRTKRACQGIRSSVRYIAAVLLASLVYAKQYRYKK
eukprot:1949071-Pleurochrysis_carterae.AAC.2